MLKTEDRWANALLTSSRRNAGRRWLVFMLGRTRRGVKQKSREGSRVVLPPSHELLNVGDFAVFKGDFHVLVHIDLLSSEIHDALGFPERIGHLVHGLAQ